MSDYRRRLMMASIGGGAPSVPEFHEFLYFDGNSYVQTDIVLPENCSIRVYLGNERARTNQCIFEATTLGGSGTTGYYLGGSTNPSDRQQIPYYDSDTWLVGNRTLAFSYPYYSFFMTPYRIGQGGNSSGYTKGSSHPTSTLRIGGTYSGLSPLYTGLMGVFLIYGSDASGCVRDSDFDSYTPVYTLRPCIYGGQVGLWNVQEGKFYGNSGTGTLSVSAWALPAEYKEVQYIQTAGKAYIDTGVAGGTDLQVLMRFSASTFLQYSSFYGNYIDENHKANRLLFSTSSSTVLVAGGNNLATSVGSFALNTIFYFLVRSDRAYRNSAAINITADSKTANTTNIALGVNKVGSTGGNDKGQRYYNFLIVKDVNLVRDYVPCKRIADSVAGFYDKVNGVFRPSDVAEAFIAGPEV